MKIEIKEKRENKLLGRTEIEGLLTFDGATPSNEVVKDMLAVEIKADKRLVVVKHIYSKFGYPQADFLAYVYDDKEMMEKIEVVTKAMRKKEEEKKKKEKAEGKKEKGKEGKVEEKTEEKKETAEKKEEIKEETK